MVAKFDGSTDAVDHIAHDTDMGTDK